MKRNQIEIALLRYLRQYEEFQKQPPYVFYEKAFLKTSKRSQENTASGSIF